MWLCVASRLHVNEHLIAGAGFIDAVKRFDCEHKVSGLNRIHTELQDLYRDRGDLLEDPLNSVSPIDSPFALRIWEAKAAIRAVDRNRTKPSNGMWRE